jgi:hypothetical protein
MTDEYRDMFAHVPQNFTGEDADKIEKLLGIDPGSEVTGFAVVYPDAEAQGLIAEVNAARMADDSENEKAYDGSNNPPKRELTARERDILVRIINDILDHKRHNPPVFREFGSDEFPIPHWEFAPVPIRIGEGDLFHTLWKIREAIDPRDE